MHGEVICAGEEESGRWVEGADVEDCVEGYGEEVREGCVQRLGGPQEGFWWG